MSLRKFEVALRQGLTPARVMSSRVALFPYDEPVEGEVQARITKRASSLFGFEAVFQNKDGI